MTLLDRYIQQQRIKKVLRYIPADSILLDIGCHQGELFHKLGQKLGYGWGVEPKLKHDVHTGKYTLLKGSFPEDHDETILVDCITMLAVIEHIPLSNQPLIAECCFRLLNKNGLLIITVPSAKTDGLLKLLTALKLIRGMSLEEHYGFDIQMIIPLYTNTGFKLIKHHPFQCGYNNLFIFQKSS